MTNHKLALRHMGFTFFQGHRMDHEGRSAKIDMQKQLFEALSHCLSQSHFFISIHLLSDGHIVFAHETIHNDLENCGFPIGGAAVVSWIKGRLGAEAAADQELYEFAFDPRCEHDIQLSDLQAASRATASILVVDIGSGELDPASRRFVILSSRPGARGLPFDRETV